MKAPRKRKRNAPSIMLQDRDRNALLMLYFCDGAMSEEQIIQFAYADTHPKNAKKRILALFDNRYLNRNWQSSKWQVYPKLIYWLAGRGYDELERLLGVEPEKRNIARNFKSSTLDHHLQVVNFRLKVIRDVQDQEGLRLGRWFSEGFFRSKAWQARVKYISSNESVKEGGVEPDGFFAIWRWAGEEPEKKKVFGYTLEIDRATEVQRTLSKSNRVTIDKKLRKGATLLSSKPYRETFGLKTGRCLIVTTGWERAENMMDLAEEADVGWAWYFSTFDEVTDPERNLLTDPVWRKVGDDRLRPLLAGAGAK